MFVDSHGRVVADSDPPGRRAAFGRSFRSRPEIRRALRGRDSTGQRYSHTLGLDVLYVAVPIATRGELHGAVRITYPLSFANERIRDSWLVLAAVGGVVLVIVFAVSVVLARSMARPVAAMERGALALGRGELDTRVAVPAAPHELHALAQSLNSTAARLEQLLGAQEAFVADASHQLRTPLAALRLRLENLERESSNAGRDDIEGALDEVNRLSALVDGLLELARVGQHGSSPVPIDARELVAARRDAWAALAEERGVSIVVDADDAVLLATPGRLEQVLDNLLNNALEVAPAGSAIVVSATRTHGAVRVSVADAGPGLTSEQRDRAFDRFWRAGDHDNERGGFGLGLAIVRQLVVADGGEVTLGASSSGGLEVLVVLPAAR